MRVLFWSELFWPHIGGSETAATTLIDALRPRGHEFRVVTRRDPPDLPDRLDYHGIAVHRLEIDQAVVDRRDPDTLLRLRHEVAKIKREFRPDLIHVSLPGPSVLLHRFTEASCWVAPTLVTLHVALTADELRPDSPIGEVTRRARWVVTCSRSLLEQTRAAMPEITARSSFVHNGLPMPSHPPAPLAIDPPRLLCIGRLVTQKGFDRAIDALSMIRRRLPSARLSIAGDGELRHELERHCAIAGVADAVEFLGWVAPRDVPALINRSAVVVMPSCWEAFGLVALHAGQMARPVVGFRVDGLPEVIVDGQTGLLVEPGDTVALAEAILRLLLDPREAMQMGGQARERARTFSVDRYARAFDNLYCRAADDRKFTEMSSS